MKVLIDALTAREGGGVTYVRQIIPALVRNAPGDEVHVLLSSQYQRELAAGLPEGARAQLIDVPADQVRRLWYEQMRLPRRVRRDAYDVLFTVNEVGAVRPGCPHVVMARNLSVYQAPPDADLTWGQWRSLLSYRLTRRPVARLALARAARVVCVSEVFRHFVVDEMGIDPAKVRVVHHGVHADFARPVGGIAADDPRLPAALRGRPYLLSVSTIAVHKNFDTLLEAYAAHASAGGGGPAPPDLAIAGRAADAALAGRLRARAESLGIAGRVHWLGAVPYAALPPLYWGALAFVLPSRMETFGNPLVEAMAAGAPVVASSLPACREVCEDAALYFDPDDAAALAAHLRAVTSDATLRERLREAGLRRATRFSWDASARALLRILAEAAGGLPNGSS